LATTLTLDMLEVPLTDDTIVSKRFDQTKQTSDMGHVENTPVGIH